MQENLYIEIENGVIKNHPAYESNLIQSFGSVPSNWIPFTRVERPKPNSYQIVLDDTPVYTIVDGVCMDVWSVREMTEEEKIEYHKDQEILERLLATQT
jgi:hypothetical protein